MAAILLKAWAFITSKAGMILGAVALGLVFVVKLIGHGYEKRKIEEIKENAEAKERMEKVPVPSSGDVVDRLRDGSF